jgi:proteasome lid subunit RPN8/RPN11
MGPPGKLRGGGADVEGVTLRIRSSDFELLRLHGEETYPQECCGVLVGEFGEAGDRTVNRVVRCGNTRTDSPEKRYQISPAELIRIQREARLSGRHIVGFYHSHPDWPARWSSTDLETACFPTLTAQSTGRFSGALSQAVERRIHVQHD